MTAPFRVLAVIPLYNHAATVRAVAQGTLARLPDVLVVDDGSTDAGAAGVADLPLTVVRHERNRGKGRAILTAVAWAAERGFSHILTLDADGQHAPADIPRFLAEGAAHPDAILVGHRDFSVANVPGSSRFGREFSNFWLRVQTGHRLGDVQSGFRLYPVWVVQRLALDQDRYAFEVEVLVKAAWAGIALRDVPISVYYPPAAERVSHFHKLTDNLRLSLLNTRLTIRSSLPWPHQKLVGDSRQQARVSIWHPVRALRQLLADNAAPATLALSVLLGVTLGALPLIGVQTLSIILVAGFFRLHKVAAVAAGQLFMPPLGPALCVELGHWLRHGRFLTEISLRTLGYEAHHRLLEWAIGGAILGPLVGLAGAAACLLLARRLDRQEALADG